MPYQAAIFDFDGTLLNTLDDLADCMNLVLSGLGMPTHPVDNYRYFVGDGMRMLAKRAAPEGTPDATIESMLGSMEKTYQANWAVKTCPYDGIPELVAELKSRGLKLAVLSNKPDKFTKAMARFYFHDGEFDIVFGVRDGVPRKPDPTAALEIANLLKVPPANFLYFGDTNTDMMTGRSAGMHTVGVSWGFRPESELREAGAELIIHKPEEALALL